jgi:uncharacterized membrane protein
MSGAAKFASASGHSAVDATIELLLGRLLRVGVILSAMLTLTGAAILLTSNGSRPGRDLIAHSGEFSRHALFHGIAHGDGNAIIMLGLMVLFATPVLRVAGMVVAFLWERDWLYTVISLGVLAILVIGICFAG